MSDLDERNEIEDKEDSKADAIAAVLVITCLTVATYIWVSSQ